MESGFHLEQLLFTALSCEEYGDTPAELALSLGSILSFRCARKWKSAHTAYRCNTCAATTSSCICVECFNASNHTGHDFFLYTSDTGGCCDCGDVHAWSGSGFCSEHSGIPLDDPSESMDPMLKHRIAAATNVAVMFPEKDLGFTLLNVICGWSDASRRVIADNICPYLPRTLEEALFWEPELISSLSNLLLELLFDLKFKWEFSKVFLPLYRAYATLAFRNNVITDSLDKLTVQLFTVPTLAIELMDNYNLAIVLVLTTEDVFSRAMAVDNTGRQVVHLGDDESFPHSVFWQVLHDLHFIAEHPECASKLIGDQEFLRHFYRVTSSIHGMDPHTRIIRGDAVNDPGYRWNYVLHLENQMVTNLSLIVHGCTSLEALLWSSSECMEALWAVCNKAESEFSMSKDPVSMFCALHRMLAWHLVKLYKDFKMLPWDVLTQLLEVHHFTDLMEDLLRVVGVVWQARLGYWVRNGRAVVGPAMSYFGIYWSQQGCEMDMVIMQSCLTILPPSIFISRLFDHLEIIPFFSTGFKFSEERDLKLLGDSLILLINIMSFNWSIWLTKEQRARYELIHWLIQDDMTFSEIGDRISKDMVEDKCFEQVLKDVSDYRAPHGLQEGVYSAKKEVYGEFDPFFVYFTRVLRDRAYRTYLSHTKVMPAFIPDAAFITHWDGLLHDRSLFSVIYLGFLVMFEGEVADFMSTHALARLLEMSVASVPTGSVSVRSLQTLELTELDFSTFTELLTVDNIVFNSLCVWGPSYPSLLEILLIFHSRNAIPELSIVISSLITAIVDRVSGDVNLAMSKYSSELLHDLFVAKESQLKALAREKRKQAAKNRQKKLLNKFAAQRDKFQDTAPQAEEVEEKLEESCSICGVQNDHVLGTACFMQTTTTRSHTSTGYITTDSRHPWNKYFGLERNNEELGNVTPTRDLVFRTCGHLLHAQCHNEYVVHQLRTEHDNGLNVNAGEFRCPICRRVGNLLFPLITTTGALLDFCTAEEYTGLFAVWETACKLQFPLQYPRDEDILKHPMLVEVNLRVQRALNKQGWNYSGNSSLLAAFESTVSLHEVSCRLELSTLKTSILLNQHPVFNRCARQAPLYKGLLAAIIPPGNPILQVLYEHLSTNKSSLYILITLMGMGCHWGAYLRLMYSVEILRLRILVHHYLEDNSMILDDAFSPTLRAIETQMIPFLRQIGFLWASLSSSTPSSKIEFTPTDPSSEVRAWLEYLQLPTVSKVLLGDTLAEKRLSKACSAALLLVGDARKVDSLGFLNFFPLPKFYHEFVADHWDTPCVACGTVPKHPGMCLICKKMVCVASGCCRVDGVDECERHVRQCCGGSGLILLLKYCIVIVVQDKRYMVWDSLYLDSHGETDVLLRRGKQLQLDPERLTNLLLLWNRGCLMHESSKYQWAELEALNQ